MLGIRWHSPALISSLVAAIVKSGESFFSIFLSTSYVNWGNLTRGRLYQFKAWKKKSIYTVSYSFLLLTTIPDLIGKILFQLRNSQLTISRNVHLTTYNVTDN